jgi:iron complex transport system ATP-binding protein
MTRLLEATSLNITLAARPVLHGVSVTLDAGEVVALVGPNGSGKTTLLRAALGHVKTDGVTWMGTPLAQWKPRELSRAIAYMPQTPTYEPGDRVVEVLRLGRSPHHGLLGLETAHDEKVLSDVARDLELTDLLDRPLDTLSGGQRQRVFLGRCLVQEPRAVLLDEPATFLDLRHQVELYRLLRQFATQSGLGVLMASHDLNLAATHADRVLVLKSGRLLASGRTAEVMTEPIMSEAFDLPMRRITVDGRHAIIPVE